MSALPQPRRGDARHRHRRARPDQIVRRPRGGARPLDAGQARHDLRLPRPERLRQDHHHPHAVRPAHARRGQRHLPRLRHPHRSRQDQDARRLHDAALQPLRGPFGAREPRIRRAHLRPAAPGARRQGDDRAARARRPRGADRRQAVGRLEAAARARRLHAAQPASSCCSTSRPPASIPRRGAISGARSTSSRPTASPCWSRPITWTRPSAATRSRTSPSAKCSRAAPSTR